jgi:hypothetical protein
MKKYMKQLKHGKFLTFSQAENITGDMTFCCVLGLTLLNLLKLEFKEMGYDITIKEKLDELAKLVQIINYYHEDGAKTTKTFSFANLTDITHKYFDKYNLFKYAYQ